MAFPFARGFRSFAPADIGAALFARTIVFVAKAQGCKPDTPPWDCARYHIGCRVPSGEFGGRVRLANRGVSCYFAWAASSACDQRYSTDSSRYSPFIRGGRMTGRRSRALALALCALLARGLFDQVCAQAKPQGEMRWALYVTLSPVWFDPGEVIGVITPFWVLYALHDALVKPMPGNHLSPSLAESWTLSADQKVYDFKLRQGVKFHNGDPFTAEDVKFSFDRAKAKLLHEKVKEVVIVEPHRVQFVLHEPWPDFMTFYGTFASGAGWIVPKKYFEAVGTDGFKKHPIGLGPYKFVSNTPGVELVMEAYEGYWRKAPSVKRLVYKSVP